LSSFETCGNLDEDSSMRKLNLKSIVWKEGTYFVSQCLNVDIASYGKTKKEALQHLDDALELYFEDQKSIRIQKVERPEIVPMSIKYA